MRSSSKHKITNASITALQGPYMYNNINKSGMLLPNTTDLQTIRENALENAYSPTHFTLL